MSLTLALATGVLGGLLLWQQPAAAFVAQPSGHDNSTGPHNWTHGDPNTALPANNGYYWLDIRAAGTTVVGELYTRGITMRFSLRNGHSHSPNLATAVLGPNGGRVFITNASPGATYGLRVENLSGRTVRDYAELNSGTPGTQQGDHDGDCGGPGPVREPDGSTPVEPAPTPGLPHLGCDNPTTAPFGGSQSSPTPSPTSTSSPTTAPSDTPAPSPSAAPSPTPSASPSPTPESSPSPSPFPNPGNHKGKGHGHHGHHGHRGVKSPSPTPAASTDAGQG